MSWIVGILSVFLILACLLLILLVLIQLPKKEAGMGQAFGGGATDALFGAGSGTALTKMTKYTTGAFLAFTLLLWVFKAQSAKHSSSLEDRVKQLEKSGRSAAPVAAGPNAAKSAPATTPSTTATTSATNAAVTNAPLLLTAPTNAAVKAPTTAPLAEEPAKPK